MKTLVLFASRYGCTEKCANMLAEKINGDVEVKDLVKNKKIGLDGYDLVIRGG